MIYWIPIYTHSGKCMKKNAVRLNRVQVAEMDYIFRSACQGLDSPDIRRMYEQHKKSNLFFYRSTDTGMRYHLQVNRKTGAVVILNVDVDHSRLDPEDSAFSIRGKHRNPAA